MLNRYRVVKPYRGFESLRLRHPASAPRKSLTRNYRASGKLARMSIALRLASGPADAAGAVRAPPRPRRCCLRSRCSRSPPFRRPRSTTATPGRIWRRGMDSPARRGPARRSLLLHFRRRAVDGARMALGSSLRARLPRRRMERRRAADGRGGGPGDLHHGEPRGARPLRNRPSRRRRARREPHRAGPAGAPAHPRPAGAGAVVRRPHAGERARRAAAAAAPGADGAVGQSARRLRLRPGADRAVRARSVARGAARGPPRASSGSGGCSP